MPAARLLRARRTCSLGSALDCMLVRSRRLELPRPFGHSDLNAARLPVPPRPHVMKYGSGWMPPPLARRAPLAKPPKGRNAAAALRNSVHNGTIPKDVFTIGGPTRYASRHAPDRRRHRLCAPAGRLQPTGPTGRAGARDGPDRLGSPHPVGSAGKRRGNPPGARDRGPDHPGSSTGETDRIRVS